MQSGSGDGQSSMFRSGYGVNLSRFLEEVNETADKIEASKTNGDMEKKDMMDEMDRLREEIDRMREEMDKMREEMSVVDKVNR